MDGFVETLKAPSDERPDAPATMTVQVYEALSEKLIGGELLPGEKVSMRNLAETLGTSVMPVREAVARLAAEGAISVSPNRAVCVPILSLSGFQELTEVRVAIEGFAAGRAARVRTASHLAEMRKHDEAFRAECRSDTPDPTVAIEANRRLHFAIYRAAGLPRLERIVSSLWLQTGPLLNLDMRHSRVRLSPGAAEVHHGRCVMAIAAGNEAAARAALEDDIRTAASFLEGTGRLET